MSGPLVEAQTRPLLAIDTEALAANVRTLARTAGAPVLAVVKAGGFGGGAEAVGRAALAAGAVGLGTATIDEAVALRTAGIAAPIISWLHPVDAEWEAALRLQIQLGVSSVEHLRRIVATARRTGTRARLHLHTDTGMTRDGASAGEWRRLVREAAAAEDAVEVVGVMGHLACADEPSHPANAAGVRAFSGAVAVVKAAGLRPRLRHLAATEAVLRLPGTGFDLVRIGGGLHGIGEGLTPTATLTTPVVLTRTVRAGTPVGYGHTAVTIERTVLATLPVGYADGVPRTLAPGAAVRILGRRCPIIGRVSMDQVVVDAGPAGVPLGAVATVFGTAPGDPSLADWARWSGTIERDVLTGIGSRVRRTVLAAPAVPLPDLQLARVLHPAGAGR